MTSNTAANKEIAKSYLVHPKEWFAGILLLTLILYARIFHFPNTGSLSDSDLFEDVHDMEEIRDKLQRVCQADSYIMCGPWWIPEDSCTQTYGMPLSYLWQRMGMERVNCALTDIMPPIQQEPGLSIEKQSLFAACFHSVNGMYFNMNELLTSRTEVAGPNWIHHIDRVGVENMVRFYIDEILSKFAAPSQLQHEGLITETWSNQEVLEIFEMAYNHSTRYLEKVTHTKQNVVFEQAIAQVLVEKKNHIKQEQGLASNDIKMSPEDILPSKGIPAKRAYVMFSTTRVDQCMTEMLQRGTFIKPICPQAILAAPTKMKELSYESGMVSLGGHGFIFTINFVCLLSLLRLLNAKSRLEKKMDRGKERLEKELNDPFLRQCLERKAQELPPNQRDRFIAKLEERIAQWDSKGAARGLVRAYVRRLRLLLLFILGLTTMFYSFFHIFHVSSMSHYLEITFCSILLLTASYAIPMGGDKYEETNGKISEILLGDLNKSDTSMAQPFLSTTDLETRGDLESEGPTVAE